MRARCEPELANLEAARRSLAARLDLPAGAERTRECLTALRPLWGIPIEQGARVLGRRLARPVAAGEIIREEDVVR